MQILDNILVTIFALEIGSISRGTFFLSKMAPLENVLIISAGDKPRVTKSAKNAGISRLRTLHNLFYLQEIFSETLKFHTFKYDHSNTRTHFMIFSEIFWSGDDHLKQKINLNNVYFFGWKAKFSREIAAIAHRPWSCRFKLNYF